MQLLQSFPVVFALLAVGNAFREAKDDEFPFQVSVQGMDKRHLCGGVIITPKWVLTVKSCVESQRSLRIAYGSVDSGFPLNVVHSQNIILESEITLNVKNSLALIELEKALEFSRTVKAAGLPTVKAELQNKGKLSGWNVMREVDVPTNLYARDDYAIFTKDCRTATGTPFNVAEDEFCGIADDPSTALTNLGSTVSNRAVVVGILEKPPLASVYPNVYVKLSEHEQWIKKVLRSDAQHVNWVDKIPPNSAPSKSAISLALIGISAIFLRFI